MRNYSTLETVLWPKDFVKPIAALGVASRGIPSARRTLRFFLGVGIGETAYRTGRLRPVRKATRSANLHSFVARSANLSLGLGGPHHGLSAAVSAHEPSKPAPNVLLVINPK